MRPADIFLLPLMFSLQAFSYASDSHSIQMIRAQSGPSGKVVGAEFVLDEVRNRFIYPQDNYLTVYFEFEAPAGEYALTAFWKDPKGVTVAISPDIRIQTIGKHLNAYWVFMIDANRASGVWTVEVRIDGQPVGSHSFELVVPEPPKPTPDSAEVPTLDEIYRSLQKSLVWIHKLDKSGRRLETSSGFIVKSNFILTSFQSIDAAVKIEIEFAGGGKVVTDQVLAFDPLGDWVLLKAETGSMPPAEIGKQDSAAVGEQLIVFSPVSNTSLAPRTIGAVDISGLGDSTEFGKRIYFKPSLPGTARGGPILDNFGKVVGILAGRTQSGTWRSYPGQLSKSLPIRFSTPIATATPIEASMLQRIYPESSIQDLLDSGILTYPLSSTPVFKHGIITNNISSDGSMQSKQRFSRDEPVIVCAYWEGNKEISEGKTSMKLFDKNNRVYKKVEPRILELPLAVMMQSTYTFKPGVLEAGTYRIDIFWDGLPVWRAFFSID
jgi:S1-C subfamily serine protease